jgi:hypothetical protein
MIKLKTSVAGGDFSHPAGASVSLDKEFESRLVETGQAEYVKQRRSTKSAGKAEDGQQS